jgi:hypothetical protein
VLVVRSLFDLVCVAGKPLAGGELLLSSFDEPSSAFATATDASFKSCSFNCVSLAVTPCVTASNSSAASSSSVRRRSRIGVDRSDDGDNRRCFDVFDLATGVVSTSLDAFFCVRSRGV